MSRPLRLEFPGSLWHITQRGNERRPTFYTDADRLKFLALLAEATRRFKWILSAYALMPNHYHLVLELTELHTLSRGMKWLNGGYVQYFNRTHERVGHLFQGRFKNFLIEKETYFLEVLRYVVLNPVRANIVEYPEQYRWSSYLATSGHIETPEWLMIDEVRSRFGAAAAAACEGYRRFVSDAIRSTRRPWDELVGSMYLGSEEWLAEIRDRVESQPRSSDHTRAQRHLLRPNMTAIIGAVADATGVPAESIRAGRGGIPRALTAWLGCYEGMLTNTEIAAALRLRSSMQVTNLVAKCEEQLRTNPPLRECVDRCVATLSRKNWKLET